MMMWRVEQMESVFSSICTINTYASILSVHEPHYCDTQTDDQCQSASMIFFLLSSLQVLMTTDTR